MRSIKRFVRRRLRVGGEPHHGWLPPGAATPLPNPAREVLVAVTVQDEGGGYLLICTSADGSYDSDTFHDSIEDAFKQAAYSFGIEPSEWQSLDG